MTRRARVLWLAKGLGRGGAERLLTTSAAHVHGDRFEVDVAYCLPWKDALVPDLVADGLRVHCLGQRSAADLGWVRRLHGLLRARDYDLVHTHMPVPAAAARLLVRRHRTRLVHTEHNVWDRYRAPTRWANALTYRRNDAVLAVSSAVLASIPAQRRPASTGVLLHGVEHGRARRGADARGEARRRLGLRDGAVVIGNVANLTPKKDQERLLQAVALLHERGRDVQLVLIGTGPLEEPLRRRAAALGLDRAVLFTGSRPDVPELLPGLDVFCLSSLHEGLSIALLEAMASEVVPVCTRVGGAPEVITDGVDGLLVPPADAVALADALQQVVDDVELRARLAAAALARSGAFDIAAAAQRIGEVYEQVLAPR